MKSGMGRAAALRFWMCAFGATTVVLSGGVAHAQCSGGAGKQTGIPLINCTAPPWSSHATYAAGVLVTYNGCQYQTNTSFVSSPSWCPGCPGVYLYGNSSACPAPGCNYGAQGVCNDLPTPTATKTGTATPTPTPTATIGSGGLPAPTLSVSHVNTWPQCGATLSWSVVSGATSYNVKKGSFAAGPFSNIATGVTATTYSGFPNDSYGVVSAQNSLGEGPISNSVFVGSCATPTATATAGATPPPPSGLNAIAACTGTSVSLSWVAVGNAQSYNAKASSVSGGPYTTVGTGITGTTFSTANRGPFYVVSGVNVWGEGPNSAQAQLLFPPCSSPTPTPTPSPTPTTRPTATATSTATATARATPTVSGICSGVPAFASCTAYGSGSKVVFKNTLYHSIAAIPSTRDCPPSSPYDPSNDNWWVNDGGC